MPPFSEENLQDEKSGESTKQKKTAPIEIPEDIDAPVDLLSETYMEVLQDHNSETFKLNMKNPAIIKNPEIVKRFLKNGLINAEGKLSAKALVRCRVLAQWRKEFEKKETAQQQPGEPIDKKLQKVTNQRYN